MRFGVPYETIYKLTEYELSLHVMAEEKRRYDKQALAAWIVLWQLRTWSKNPPKRIEELIGFEPGRTWEPGDPIIPGFMSTEDLDAVILRDKAYKESIGWPTGEGSKDNGKKV